jgi:hypothetical protein
MEAIKIVGRLKGTNCHGRYWSVAVGIFAEANNRTDFNFRSRKKATLAFGCKTCSRLYTGVKNYSFFELDVSCRIRNTL